MRVLLCTLAAAAIAVSASAQSAVVRVPTSPSTISRQDQHLALNHYKLGQEALHREALDEAKREFEASAKLDPFLELAPYGLGEVHMARHEYDAAVHAYLKCREIFQSNASSAMNKGLDRQQRTNDQIQALQDQRSSFESGRLTAQFGNLQGVLQQLDIQISQLKVQRNRQADGPIETPAWISLALGSAYFRSDSLPDAEREYRAALHSDPKLGEAHNNLAVVLMLSGQYAEAEQEITLAESSGFKVNPQLKADLKKAKGS